MKLKILAVGAKMPGWIREGFASYARRMPPSQKIEMIEIAASTHKNDPRRYVVEEGERLLRRVRDNDWLVALDEHGRGWSTVDLAKRLDEWQMKGSDVVFAIGGSDGLSDAVFNRADERASLSALTFPHHMVKVILAEALYRAWTINSGHPYHRASPRGRQRT